MANDRRVEYEWEVVESLTKMSDSINRAFNISNDSGKVNVDSLTKWNNIENKNKVQDKEKIKFYILEN